jgi:cyclin-dependent kinase 12/13
MKQLLEGLAYCHAQKVLHRDIKGSNLLISHDGQLKLADFGLARAYDSEKQHEYTNRVITLWYRPPELLLGASMYGPAIDMWSAGCIFAELLLRKPILPGKNEFEQIDLIFKLLGTPDEAEWPRCKALKYYDLILSQVPRRYSNRFDEKFSTLDPTAKDLLRKLLTLDPEKRISADEALNHEYFWTDPMPALPAELPKYPPSHEFTAKKRRQANAQQAQQQPPAPAPAPVASTAEPHGHHDKKHDPSAPYGAGAHGGARGSALVVRSAVAGAVVGASRAAAIRRVEHRGGRRVEHCGESSQAREEGRSQVEELWKSVHRPLDR